MSVDEKMNGRSLSYVHGSASPLHSSARATSVFTAALLVPVLQLNETSQEMARN